MLLKLMGGALLLCACFCISYYYSSTERKRIAKVRGVSLLVRYIKDNVDWYSMPIDKILLSCREDILLNLGVENIASDLSELCKELEPMCDRESGRILKSLARDFGKGYREHQMKMCDVAISELEKHLEILESTYPIRKRRITTICFSLGGMILIALW